jgi:hypothetical protein
MAADTRAGWIIRSGKHRPPYPVAVSRRLARLTTSPSRVTFSKIYLPDSGLDLRCVK